MAPSHTKRIIMKAGIAVAAALVGMLAGGNTMADGNKLFSQCKIAIRGNANASVNDALQAGLCMGLIQGVHETLLAYGNVLPKKERICFPDGITKDQNVKVVYIFLEDNPKYLHELETVLVIAAFTDAYPCSD